ncbi:hypothetical protein MtrunA17_Chr4g0043551 [Medicago truncatula]|uniref:Transmembrane protein, putative n=1 Tax=Medicago truncatula TaxID=3880 RepID=G7JIS8_MEDTR|nr:transmembrane protein, putative [Medicago truncatula]RHN62082.1 hypothetical protein MtrunA17_Chr4g0043551 [Medicago truncatula]
MKKNGSREKKKDEGLFANRLTLSFLTERKSLLADVESSCGGATSDLYPLHRCLSLLSSGRSLKSGYSELHTHTHTHTLLNWFFPASLHRVKSFIHSFFHCRTGHWCFVGLLVVVVFFGSRSLGWWVVWVPRMGQGFKACLHHIRRVGFVF